MSVSTIQKWETIKEKCSKKQTGETQLFERTESEKKKYTQASDECKKEYLNGFADSLFIKLFKSDAGVSDGKKFALKDTYRVDQCLVKNSFPYDLGPEIQHWLIWSVKPLNKNEIQEKYYHAKELKDYDLIIFENAHAFKTVGSIPHVHVFTKKCLDLKNREIKNYI